MRLSTVLLLLLCTQLAQSNFLTKSRQKGTPGPKGSQRKAKKVKSRSKRESTPSPTRSLTRKPTHSPTPKPTRFVTSSPTWVPITDNVFDLSNDVPTEPPQQETIEDAPPARPQFVTISVSVALSHSAPQVENLKEMVAKVMTLLIRSFTSFRVDMEGRRRQSTDLVYDEEHSKVVLAFHAPQVSWWRHSVAYAFTEATEEQTEMTAIANLTESSVEGAIQSGLFVQLLAQETTMVHGVAIPGFELEQELDTTSVKATETEKGHGTWDYRATILVTCFFATVVVAGASITIITRRRWKQRQREWETWSIAVGPQRNVGEILNTDWKTDYSEAVPSATNSSFLRMTADGTIQATTNGTETSIPLLS